MYDIKQIGYMPGYSGDPRYNWTKQYSRKVNVTFDLVDHDPDADFNVLVQCEPPKLYIAFKDMVYRTYQNFDLILTYDDRLLELPNAKEFCPVGSWIGDVELDKKDQITFMMSSKINSHEYRMRFMILDRYGKKNKMGNFDFLMHRTPPRTPFKEPFFINAKFHIACENQVMTNMFTEKLLDCFKTHTVPIYYGCTNIEKYFNPKGIIRFNTIEEFEDIVNNITPDTYDQMQEYIKENYELAKPYWEKSIFQRIEEKIDEEFALEQRNNLIHDILLD
jgi:hypothetical protein